MDCLPKKVAVVERWLLYPVSGGSTAVLINRENNSMITKKNGLSTITVVSTSHKNYNTFVSPAFATSHIQSMNTIVSYNVMITNI